LNVICCQDRIPTYWDDGLFHYREEVGSLRSELRTTIRTETDNAIVI